MRERGWGARLWQAGWCGLGLALSQAAPVVAASLGDEQPLEERGALYSFSGLLDSRTRRVDERSFQGVSGQKLSVALDASHPGVSLQIWPASGGAALSSSFIRSGERWTGALPASGEYFVRVSLRPSASRRVERASYAASVMLEAPKEHAGAPKPVPDERLVNTAWQLLRIEAENARSLLLRAGQREKYTLFFGADGRVTLRADCNRGQGAWASPGEGLLTFSALSLKRPPCAPEGLDARFVRDLSSVRSFGLRDDRLFLSLSNGGGRYELVPLAARERGPVRPSFDCAEAKAVVEQRICGDRELAVRDRRLAELYAASLRVSGGTWEPWLLAGQRAFIEQRNACEESDDQLGCLERVYDRRLAEVEVKSKLVASRWPVKYECADVRGTLSELSVTFHESEPPSVTLERDAERVFAVLASAEDNERYEAENVAFWERKGGAAAEWRGVDLRCVRAR